MCSNHKLAVLCSVLTWFRASSAYLLLPVTVDVVVPWESGSSKIRAASL